MFARAANSSTDLCLANLRKQQKTDRAVFTLRRGVGTDSLQQGVPGRISTCCFLLGISSLNSFFTPVKIYLTVFINS